MDKPARPSDVAAVERLFEEKLEKATREVLKAGHVEQHTVAELDGLKKLLDHHGAKVSAAPSRRNTLLVFAVIVVVIGGFLLSHPDASVDVAVDATRFSSIVSVVSGRNNGAIVKELTVNSVALTGVLAQRVPEGLFEEPNIDRLNDGNPIKLTASRGTIQIKDLTLPAGSTFDVTAQPAVHQIASNHGPTGAIRVVLSGDGTFSLLGQSVFSTSYHTNKDEARELVFSAAKTQQEFAADLETTTSPTLPCFGSSLMVDDVSFDERLLPLPVAAEASAVSALRGGRITFTAIGDRTLSVKPMQPLSFEALRLTLRRICLTSGALSVEGSGLAADVVDGPSRQSVTPTRLDWWAKSHPMVLFASSVAYVFGLFLSVSNWWGKAK